MTTETSDQSIAEKKKATDQQIVYNTLLRLGEATDQEIVSHLGYSDPNIVRPRRKELCDIGDIVLSRHRVCRITGKWVTAWKVADNQKTMEEYVGLSHTQMITIQRHLKKANKYQLTVIHNWIKENG